MDNTMLLAGVIKESIVDGVGLRFVLFAQGCPHHCVGCHNPATHPFHGGTAYPIDHVFDEILKNPLLHGVTFSGGEPFCQADAFATLGVKIKRAGLSIITYSGYTIEQLSVMAQGDEAVKNLLCVTDYLVDGKFELSQKSLALKFKGSCNQRVLDVAHFLKTNEIKEIDFSQLYAAEFPAVSI